MFFSARMRKTESIFLRYLTLFALLNYSLCFKNVILLPLQAGIMDLAKQTTTLV